MDISSNGVLMCSPEVLKMGAMGNLGIECDRETIRAAVVARHHVPGVGIAFEFSHMSPPDRRALHRLLLSVTRQAPAAVKPPALPNPPGLA